MKNAAIIVAAVVVLAGGFLVAKNNSEESREASAPASAPAGAVVPATVGPAAAPEAAAPPEPAPAASKVPVVRVVDGKPRGGVQTLKFDRGDRVRFTVASDSAGEIHVHGFDLTEDVEAGGEVVFDFTARADGRYEVELEELGVAIAELQIDP